MTLDNPAFWLAIGQIIWINILLSGDNAVVIALACRSLTGRTRWWGMVLGAGAAIVLRILFTGIVTTLMAIPYLKIGGALALIYIAVELIRPKAEEGEVAVDAADTLFRAVITIVVADLVMSLDNVIAIAAVAQGSWTHLIIGLAISIPMIISGSLLIIALLDRLPVLVWAGAGLLGWIAGVLISSDVAAVSRWGAEATHRAEIPLAIAGAALVIGLGLLLARRAGSEKKPPG
jgi:YjbE family integral membrane protein